MEQYNVTGMSCAACSARVEKAVSKVPEVLLVGEAPGANEDQQGEPLTP